jgi:hypothetical protein
MDALIPLLLSAVALLGIVAAIAGVESRDGFVETPEPFRG